MRRKGVTRRADKKRSKKATLEPDRISTARNATACSAVTASRLQCWRLLAVLGWR